MLEACGFDTETHLIAADAIVPRLVCATFDVAPFGSDGDGEAWITPNSDPELVGQLVHMLRDVMSEQVHLIIQNASFDLTVLMRFAWEVERGMQAGNRSDGETLRGLIWEALEKGLRNEEAGRPHFVHDTIIREKLFNLSTIGSVDQLNGRDIRYGLDALVQQHFGIDISAAKVSTDARGRVYDSSGADITGTAAAGASWRLRYAELDGLPLERWPMEARTYAIEDATWARKVFVRQEARRQPDGYGSMNSESLQVYADAALRLYSISGFPVDRTQVQVVHDHVGGIIGRVNAYLMINGIVRPNGSVCQAELHKRVEAAWATLGRHAPLTDAGRICADADVLEQLAGVDPVLDMYRERQEFVKIQTAFLPSLSGGRIWSNYDILKETGRISAYGSGERGKRKPLYPAMNITQIPRANGVRECFLPPEIDSTLTSPWLNGAPVASVLCSADYAALELCSVAQVTYGLLGWSVHREKNLLGYDLHSYLGAQMARALEPEVVDEQSDPDAAYRALVQHRKAKVKDEDTSPEAEHIRKLKKRAAHWRNLAKPVGLGFPGGLGPGTMVGFARTTYGVLMDEDQARAFRDLWRVIYPEMPEFFRWVDRQKDMQVSGDVDAYCYETPGLRRFRAGASYCATANGMSMQSLSADGAKRSTCWMARSCFGGVRKEESPLALLTGCLPAAFIHDENLIALPDDELLTERALIVSALMVQALAITMPDVKLGAEPALMRRWTKGAEPEWVDDPGREQRVEAALTAWYGGTPPDAWLDELFALLGPTYNPNRRLVPWDDVHDWRKK